MIDICDGHCNCGGCDNSRDLKIMGAQFSLTMIRDLDNSDRLTVQMVGPRSETVYEHFLLPFEAMAAFQAGEDWRPILDYLIEHYADTHPWLEEAVRRVSTPEPSVR